MKNKLIRNPVYIYCIVSTACFVYASVLYMLFLTKISNTLDTWGWMVWIPIILIVPFAHIKYNPEREGLFRIKKDIQQKLRIFLYLVAINCVINIIYFILGAINTPENHSYKTEGIVGQLYASILMIASLYVTLYFLIGKKRDEMGRTRIGT